MTTANLQLTEWTANQTQPEVAVNESLNVVDSIITATFTHNIAADADYTLGTTGSKPYEWQYSKIKITDTGVTLTGPVNIIVPALERPYTFQNDTAETLTLKTPAGSGIAVERGLTARLRCDGTDVISDESVLFQGSEFRGYTETKNAIVSATGAVSLSCASANVFDLVLVGNASVTFTDVPSVGSRTFTSTVFVKQDGTGTRALNFVGAIYASGQASTVSQAPNNEDIWILTTKDFGSTWYAMAGGLAFG